VSGHHGTGDQVVQITFNVGSDTTYSVLLGVPAATSATTSSSATSTGTAATTGTTGDDSVTVSPAAQQLLQSSTNAALLSATLGGNATVTSATDLSTSTTATDSTAAQNGDNLDSQLITSVTTQTPALTKLQTTNPGEAAQLGAELTMLQGSLSTTA
jgi:hypothetical protein